MSIWAGIEKEVRAGTDYDLETPDANVYVQTSTSWTDNIQLGLLSDDLKIDAELYLSPAAARSLIEALELALARIAKSG